MRAIIFFFIQKVGVFKISFLAYYNKLNVDEFFLQKINRITIKCPDLKTIYLISLTKIIQNSKFERDIQFTHESILKSLKY